MRNQPQKEKNQTEGEFFNIVGTGRKGVEDMFGKMSEEIMSVAVESVRKMENTWKQRALLSIVNNENLKGVLATRKGIYSIYNCMIEAVQMGLQLGGHFPHAHLVPFKGEAKLIATKEGYIFCSVHSQDSVLSSAEIQPVHDGENFKIDLAAKTVSHTFDPGKNKKGKLILVYGIFIGKDGKTKRIDYRMREQIMPNRERSSSYQAYKAGKISENQCTWITDEDAMIIKSAAKSMLKPYAAESEGLAMLYKQDIESIEAPEPDMRDVTERMSDKLDSAIEGMEPGEGKKEEPKSDQETIQPEPGKKPGDLF